MLESPFLFKEQANSAFLNHFFEGIKKEKEIKKLYIKSVCFAGK